MNRLKHLLMATVFVLASFSSASAQFQLMKLPYATDALEPVISKQTVELHHGKHLAGYVKKLNKLIQGTPFASVSDVRMIAKYATGSIADNAGQLLNHNLYFEQFSPKGGGMPQGKLGERITAQWGSFEAFQKEFKQAAIGVFGSGWAWLSSDEKGNLSIVTEANGNNPVRRGLTPLMGIDLWEHAYYLDYTNDRGKHLDEVWRIIDWQVVELRYQL